jgi:hypothetical protein
MIESPSAYPVSAILFEEGQSWAAQCLEYDIAAQAASLSDLLYELQRVLVSHLSIAEELGSRPFEGLEPAPQKFWDMYERSHARIELELAPFRLPHPTALPPVSPRLKIADSREMCDA